MTTLNSQHPGEQTSNEEAPRPRIERALIAIGEPFTRALDYIGGMWNLCAQTLNWCWRSAFLRKARFGRYALYSQVVRVGVRSMGVVMLVSCCIGLILALQMAPPLAEFNQTSQVATIIAIAVVRELGPLISAIVLTGFAGASIAAELGTMVVGEEVEALEAHALNPVRFLVMPRLLATTGCLVVLCIIGEFCAIGSGYWMGTNVLGINRVAYLDNTLGALDMADFGTGLFKAGVFGLLIGSIACYNGLNVKGGAEGVGKATTNTVVHSIVAIIFIDLVFTMIFFKLGWT